MNEICSSPFEALWMCRQMEQIHLKSGRCAGEKWGNVLLLAGDPVFDQGNGQQFWNELSELSRERNLAVAG